MFVVSSNRNVARTGGRAAEPAQVKLARGERLKALRLALGRTQETIAKDGEFPREDMSRFERGEKLSSEANRRKLAKGFGINLDLLAKLLDGEVSANDVAHGRALVGVEMEAAAAYAPQIHPTIAAVAGVSDYTDEEAELASFSIRGLLGTASMTEEQALEFLSKARIMRRDNARALAPTGTPVRNTGGSALEELGGGRGSLPTKSRRRK